MASVRYVFLSDLHFGERNGILSDPLGPELSAPLEANDALARLVEVLHDVARANPDGSRPRLVLLGDVFELALAPPHVALEGFARFVEGLFPPDGEAPFDPRLVLVPGNHDHDLWTSTRDDLLDEQLERQGGRLGPTAPVTGIFDLLSPEGDGAAPEPPQSRLLTSLLRARVPHRPDLEVQVAYPNLGILAGDRALVAHHGHFMDDVYLLMSTLSRSVFGTPTVAEVAGLESDNGPWIGFLWSSLGREGDIAAGLRRSYDLLQSDGGKILLASRLAAAFVGRSRWRFGRRLRQRLLMPVLIRILDALEQTDIRRSLPATTRVPPEALGYLDGPLAATLEAELRRRGVPKGAVARWSYVYGHTHRPLAEGVALPRRGVRASVYNTGGWVVDGTAPRPATSGGVLLVDERLDAVLVRIGAQVVNPHLEPAAVLRADEEDSELHRHVAALIARPEGPWRKAAAALGAAILRRRAEHAARLVGEVDELNGYERLALRSEYIWKLLARRRTRSEALLRARFGPRRRSFLQRSRLVREKSPLALPAGTVVP